MRQIWTWFWPGHRRSAASSAELPCPACGGILGPCPGCDGEWRTERCRQCALGRLCEGCGIHHWIG
jgi:hypothetical protein